MPLAADDLGREVLGAAAQRRRALVGRRLGREAEVEQLDVTRRVEQQVLGPHVAVHLRRRRERARWGRRWGGAEERGSGGAGLWGVGLWGVGLQGLVSEGEEGAGAPPPRRARPRGR